MISVHAVIYSLAIYGISGDASCTRLEFINLLCTVQRASCKERCRPYVMIVKSTKSRRGMMCRNITIPRAPNLSPIINCFLQVARWDSAIARYLSRYHNLEHFKMDLHVISADWSNLGPTESRCGIRTPCRKLDYPGKKFVQDSLTFWYIESIYLISPLGTVIIHVR